MARYFRSDVRQNLPVSTEITGYSISALAFIWKLTGDDACRLAALGTARFLTEKAWNPALETFPFEHFEQEAPDALAYFFDCGVIARGLLSAWRLTADKTFLGLAVACGKSMARDFASGSGFHPVLTLPEKRPLPGNERWSRQPGCYQLKSAMAWHDLFELTGDDEFRLNYEAVLADSLRTHSSFLTAEPQRDRVMDRLHAYAYFLEGLLPAAGRAECAAALEAGIQSITSRHRAISPEFERADVCAQLLRIRLFAASLGIVPLDRDAAREEAARIPAFQINDPDPRLDGGFWFGRRNGQMLPYVNPITTVFCVQALEMWRQYEAGVFRPDRLQLI